MTTISTNDLPIRLADGLAGPAIGEEFLVTDHGRPVARILPPETTGPALKETNDEWVAR